MHRSVLDNASYVKFARENTVEVVTTEELERAVTEKSPHIKTHKARDPWGDELDFLVKFPGHTIDTLREISNDPDVIRYMEGGKIPYTAIVDPHTDKEMHAFKGVISAKTLITAIKAQRAVLEKKHGKGVARADWNRVTQADIDVDNLLGAEDIAKALAVHTALQKKTARRAKVLTDRVEVIHAAIMRDARAALKQAETLTQMPTGAAGRKLRALLKALHQTELANQAQTLQKKLND